MILRFTRCSNPRMCMHWPQCIIQAILHILTSISVYLYFSFQLISIKCPNLHEIIHTSHYASPFYVNHTIYDPTLAGVPINTASLCVHPVKCVSVKALSRTKAFDHGHTLCSDYQLATTIATLESIYPPQIQSFTAVHA